MLNELKSRLVAFCQDVRSYKGVPNRQGVPCEE